MNAEIPVVNTRFIRVNDWLKYHPWPDPNALRHLIFHAKAKRFERVVIRCGRRVLIDEAAFFQWVQAHKGDAPGGAS